MKRYIKILLVALLAVTCLTACKTNTSNTRADIVFIEDYSSSNESDFEALVNSTIAQAAQANGHNYRYYRMTNVTTESFQQTVDLSISFDAKLIFVTEIMKDAVLAIHDQYPDITFVLIDVDIDEETIGEVKNIVRLTFDEYELGYIVGYVYGYHGYNKIGYLYQTSDDSNLFGYGLIYGYRQALENQEKTGGTVLLKCVDNMSSLDIQKYIAKEVTNNGFQSFVSVGADLNVIVDSIISQVSASMVCTEFEPVNRNNVLFEAHRGYAKVIEDAILAYIDEDTPMPGIIEGDITKNGLYISYLSSSPLMERAKRAFDTFADANRNGSIIETENIAIPYSKMKLTEVTVEDASVQKTTDTKKKK